ncbi:Hypothetical predicted protein [Marmota monax]|uniref:Uncharacterized protein n=1 Tax=Marmota monax TaxID=9995 RepID=A0A5E4B220_MARMO|nr:hypothetical protein GHT09_015233 [Marmota monax]VTJ63200.1 Hypothetical predicted protein [Marmota monax]
MWCSGMRFLGFYTLPGPGMVLWPSSHLDGALHLEPGGKGIPGAGLYSYSVVLGPPSPYRPPPPIMLSVPISGRICTGTAHGACWARPNHFSSPAELLLPHLFPPWQPLLNTC